MVENDNNNYVIDDRNYGSFKDTNGNVITIRDVQDVVFKIILEIDRVFRKNNIGYALAYGSTLGLYNYHDFIPWDDDMDIAVDYFDIPRIIEAFQKDLGDEYTFDSYETDKRYNPLIVTMKVRLKDTYIREQNWLTLPNRCKNGNGLFIDIVAFMGVPEKKEDHLKLIKYSKRIMPWYVALDGFLRIHPHGFKKKLKAFEAKVANDYKDSKFVAQTVIIPFQDWGEDKDKISFPYDVIYPFREYDFRGVKLFSFNDIREFCKLCYGERSLRKFDGEKWYDPYPERKRHSHHVLKINLGKYTPKH